MTPHLLKFPVFNYSDQVTGIKNAIDLWSRYAIAKARKLRP
ncbi:hypothetical protein [Moorena sp. SIO3I8]|nr:hypothetical protein [Moorena sp. SIO3I8]